MNTSKELDKAFAEIDKYINIKINDDNLRLTKENSKLKKEVEKLKKRLKNVKVVLDKINTANDLAKNFIEFVDNIPEDVY